MEGDWHLWNPAPSPQMDFFTCKMISQNTFSQCFIIKLFMHLETRKQMRLSNPFTPSYSRATSAASALWSVAKAGARKANFQDLSSNLQCAIWSRMLSYNVASTHVIGRVFFHLSGRMRCRYESSSYGNKDISPLPIAEAPYFWFSSQVHSCICH